MTGRVRSSDATRAAILAAARERFAADGYERATIRAIAADARIDPSMVMRYFGSKERLLAAAADFELRLPDVHAIPRELLGARLVAHFLDRWEEDDTTVALLRAGATHEAAAERLRAVFAEQVSGLVATVAPGAGQVPARSGLVAAQMLGLALTRYVLRLPPVVAMTREELVGWVGPAIQRYLTGEAPGPAPAG